MQVRDERAWLCTVIRHAATIAQDTIIGSNLGIVLTHALLYLTIDLIYVCTPTSLCSLTLVHLA